jgi:hypothetical protein
MGLILSEPINKVVEIPKILMKMSVEDAKTHLKFWTLFLRGGVRYADDAAGQIAPRVDRLPPVLIETADLRLSFAINNALLHCCQLLGTIYSWALYLQERQLQISEDTSAAESAL